MPAGRTVATTSGGSDASSSHSLRTLSAKSIRLGWPPATIWSSSPAYVAFDRLRFATHIACGVGSSGASGSRTQPLTWIPYDGTPK